jgi:hypothetical protein
MGDGSWGGSSGITSGSAAAAGGTRAVGYMIDAGVAATIAFAAPGDANLDGLVDLDDIVGFVNAELFDTGLAATWATGDFDYNGLVDLDDVIKFVGTGLYDKGSYLPAALGGLGVASPINTGSPAEITSLGEASIVMVVPEPGGWEIVLQAAVAGAMALASRRRRA